MEGFSRLNWIEMTHILDLEALLLEDAHTRLDTHVTDRTLVAPPPGLGHVGPCLTFDWSLSLSAMMELKNLSIRVSIVGLSAELFICKRISSETKGTYEVALDDSHLQEALLVHVSPPLALQTQDSCLMKMGLIKIEHIVLPKQKNLKRETATALVHVHLWDTTVLFRHVGGDVGFPTYQENTKPAMCYCHLDTKEPDEGWSTTGYFCPQCQSKYCTLPIECKVCGLTLVSATHLARSYHHLFPIDNYEEVPFADVHERVCYGCQDVLKEKMVSQCPQCSRIFCLECDVFVHSSLHVCPGCSNTPST
ncbi:GTF2H2 [Cordylochernes scorpioides]|uniref:GTF2H2 n=1 Tax=Cordylochernes scorpioides TaxID=51811 RepID=A0ABY6LPX9_9ARAC|nr:GTF2H2 [Cordylochernes scorpioides]